ncbi:hypothetical protein [Saccharothrix sp. ST-888]|uniref:hypothetical protein n=1 Tax=Saccharothrix sp. ST-888 TaxID=1427391 RepID=UPI0006986CEF|nr:hypothetical protein [Saccharothrix sp. ST-888]
MKQATLKAAGTAALGVALAAAAAGSASAATGGGLGLPTSALSHSDALTGAATSATGKLPAAAPVTEAVGNLNSGVGSSLAPAAPAAPAAQAPAADAAPGADPEAPAAATKAVTRAGLPVPGAEGLSKLPGVGTLTGALPGGIPG